MRTSRIIRLAAILQTITAVGHLIGHFSVPRPANETEATLLKMMAGYQREFAGGSMSVLDIHDGLNLCYALFFLFAGCLNFIITSNLGDQKLMGRASLINALAMATGLFISLIYFFWIPVTYFCVCTMLFLIACVRSRNFS